MVLADMVPDDCLDCELCFADEETDRCTSRHPITGWPCLQPLGHEDHHAFCTFHRHPQATWA